MRPIFQPDDQIALTSVCRTLTDCCPRHWINERRQRHETVSTTPPLQKFNESNGGDDFCPSLFGILLTAIFRSVMNYGNQSHFERLISVLPSSAIFAGVGHYYPEKTKSIQIIYWKFKRTSKYFPSSLFINVMELRPAIARNRQKERMERYFSPDIHFTCDPCYERTPKRTWNKSNNCNNRWSEPSQKSTFRTPEMCDWKRDFRMLLLLWLMTSDESKLIDNSVPTISFAVEHLTERKRNQ